MPSPEVPTQTVQSEIDETPDLSPPDGGAPGRKPIRWGAVIGLALALMLVSSAAGYLIGTQLVAAIVPPFAPAEDGEVLVIITNFLRGPADEQIYDDLSAYFASDDTPDVRVEWFNRRPRNRERALLTQFASGATIVVWGERQGRDIQVHDEIIELTRMFTSQPAPVTIRRSASPDARNTAIAETEYVILFKLGEFYFMGEDRAAAYALFSQALTALGETTRAEALQVGQTALLCGVIAQEDYGDAEAAINYYSQVLDINPDYAEAHAWRGGLYFESEAYEAAAADFSSALELGYDEALMYFNRARALSGMGEYQLAVEDYTRVIETDAESFPDAYYQRAGAYQALGEYEQALDDYNHILELDPANAEGYAGRGYVYAMLGEYEQSVESYTTAIELDGSDVLSYNGRGYAYYKLQERELAIEDCTRAIEIDPGYVGAYLNRGNSYVMLGDTDQALAEYTRAIELDPDYIMAYQNRAYLHVQLEEYEQAIADYTRAIELNPDNIENYVDRSEVYAALEEYPLVVDDLTRILELSTPGSDTYTWASAKLAVYSRMFP